MVIKVWRLKTVVGIRDVTRGNKLIDLIPHDFLFILNIYIKNQNIIISKDKGCPMVFKRNEYVAAALFLYLHEKN